MILKASAIGKIITAVFLSLSIFLFLHTCNRSEEVVRENTEEKVLKPEFPIEGKIVFQSNLDGDNEIYLISQNEIKKLTAAGIRFLQVGLESLNDQTLRQMNKATTVLFNIYLLKMALENGIRIMWHILYGIPGEKDEWYADMAAILPLLFHLQPPDALVHLHLDRFSSYHNNPVKYKLNLFPSRAYSYAFPFSEKELHNFAYYFESEHNIKNNLMFLKFQKRAFFII